MIEIDPRSFDKLEDTFDEEFKYVGDERIIMLEVSSRKPDESPLNPGRFMYKQNDTTVK